MWRPSIRSENFCSEKLALVPLDHLASLATAGFMKTILLIGEGYGEHLQAKKQHVERVESFLCFRLPDMRLVSYSVTQKTTNS